MSKMANEKRLIDAKTLYDELSTLSVFVSGIRAGRGVLNEYMKEYRKSVLRVIDEQPTVDAVEVVRCKDCKWRHTMGCVFECVNAVEREDHDFCSDGERKS